MKLLYLRDFKVKPKNFHNLNDDGIRTLSVYAFYNKFGLSIEFNYGITIVIGCFEVNYLE